MAYKKIKNEHCCEDIIRLIESDRCPLVYDPYIRQYRLATPAYYLRKNELGGAIRLYFCPCCGTEFPSFLGDLREEILENEYGFEGGSDQAKLIPKEFMTEEWWRKRGL